MSGCMPWYQNGVVSEDQTSPPISPDSTTSYHGAPGRFLHQVTKYRPIPPVTERQVGSLTELPSTYHTTSYKAPGTFPHRVTKYRPTSYRARGKMRCNFATFCLLLTTLHRRSNKVICDYEKVSSMGQCDKLSNSFEGLPW